MARRDEKGDGHRRPRPRPPLTERQTAEVDGEGGMTHAQLVEALHATDGLVDVTVGSADRPNFNLRHKPFLHFHTDPASGDLYADVKLGGGPASDFEPVWASTPAEREDLLRRVRKRVRRVGDCADCFTSRCTDLPDLAPNVLYRGSGRQEPLGSGSMCAPHHVAGSLGRGVIGCFGNGG